MDAQKALVKIEELVKLYKQYGNRMVLTNLRGHVTQLTRRNPLFWIRIEEIFERNCLGMTGVVR